MAAPLISVVMPVYNDELYLPEAVDSILGQTLADFEFIVINDGSTDATKTILNRYQDEDERLKVYDQENQGLVAALNRGCSLAKGKYIARMDADDISLPRRLEKQAAFMEADADAGIVGTWAGLIDGKSRETGIWRLPTLPGVIGWSFFFTSSVVHPSAIMRRDVVEALGFYDPAAAHAEDYDLWARAAKITKIFNIGEVLLKRRTRPQSVSSLNSRTQVENTIKIMKSIMADFLHANIPYETASLILAVQRADFSSLKTLEDIESATDLIKRLHRAYLETVSLTRRETGQIAVDVARKLAILAFSARRLSPGKSLSLLAQALRLDPQLAFRIIAKSKRMVYTRDDDR